MNTEIKLSLVSSIALVGGLHKCHNFLALTFPVPIQIMTDSNHEQQSRHHAKMTELSTVLFQVAQIGNR